MSVTNFVEEGPARVEERTWKLERDESMSIRMKLFKNNPKLSSKILKYSNGTRNLPNIVTSSRSRYRTIDINLKLQKHRANGTAFPIILNSRAIRYF